MKRTAYIRFLIPALVLILLCGIFSTFAIQRFTQNAIAREMSAILAAATESRDRFGDPAALAEEVSDLCYGYRITVIDRDGTVLGDTQEDPAQLANHADRLEFAQSQAKGEYVALRYSNTLHENVLYIARRMQDHRVVRVSVPVSSIYRAAAPHYLLLAVVMLIVLFICLLLCILLVRFFEKPIVELLTGLKRALKGEKRVRLSASQYAEFVTIAAAMRKLSKQARKNRAAAGRETQKLVFLLDTIRQGIVLVDRNKNVVQMNKSAKLILNRPEELLGKPLLYACRQPQIIAAVENSIHEDRSAIFDIIAEETDRIYSVSVNRVDGKWIRAGAILVFTDVTDVRRAEQLRREFVSNASHELKTPVTSIQGFAQLLSSGMVQDPAKMQDYLQRIQDEAQRMTNLISDILKLSAIEEGTEQKAIRRLSVREFTEEVLSLAAQLAEEKNVALGTEVPEDLFIQADHEDMTRLLSNLVVNAVKYNKTGGSVYVRAGAQGQFCVIEVQDTGIGIPEADITRVFERFYTVDKGRSEGMGGTGLGLSIVKHLVAFYDGEIHIESRENEGTTITVKLAVMQGGNAF